MQRKRLRGGIAGRRRKSSSPPRARGSEAIGTKDSPSPDLRGTLRQLMTADADWMRHAVSCTVCNQQIHNGAEMESQLP